MKKSFLKIFICMGIALFIFASTVDAASITYFTTTDVNLRASAGSKGKILTHAKKGTNITISQTKKVGSSTWGYGTVNKKTGWVSMSYLKKVADNTEVQPLYINGILIVNKEHSLPSTYAPGENVEARSEFNKMAKKAKAEGYNLTAFSTYRSYTYQKGLFDRYVKNNGVKAANRFSAKAGQSEHQTGLAFDVGEKGKENQWVSQNFGKTDAGKWVALNAHHFGFIIRYPEGKESITGYMYEPWHLRYLGKDIATEVYTSGLTLEEYLKITH